MQFTIPSEALKPALKAALAIVPSKPYLPILTCLYLEASEGHLTIIASDLQTTLSLSVPAVIGEVGAACFPAKTLSDIISTIDGHITIACSDTQAGIQGDRLKSKLNIFPADEFPLPKDRSPSSVALFNAAELSSAIKATAPCAAKDETRPILQGLRFAFGDGTCDIVAADGFRMASANVAYEQSADLSPVTIPAAALLDLLPLMAGADEVLICQRQGGQNVEIIIGDDVRAEISLLEGNYPDYSRVIPSAHRGTQAAFQRGDFLLAIKRANIFAADSAYSTRLMAGDGRMTIAGKSAERGATEDIITAHTEGIGEASFNGQYLAQAAAAFSDDSPLCLSFAEEGPLLLTSDSSTLRFAIMPMSR